MAATPVAARPWLFLGIAALIGLVAVPMTAVAILVVVSLISGRFSSDEALSLEAVPTVLAATLVIWVLLVLDTVLMARVLTALIMFTRALAAADRDAVLGTFDVGFRVLSLVPHTSTAWSRFLVNVQQRQWRRWRVLAALYLVVLAGCAMYYWSLDDSPLAHVVALVVLLGGAAVLMIWQWRAGDAVSARDASREHDVAARERERLDLLRAAALAPDGSDGRAPTAFDVWVHAEIMDAFREDPFALLAVREGRREAIAGPLRAAFIATRGLVDVEALRILVSRAARANAQPRAAKRSQLGRETQAATAKKAKGATPLPRSKFTAAKAPPAKRAPGPVPADSFPADGESPYRPV